MPKRKNGHSASGDSPTVTVTQKRPKMPDIDYQKLAEEILKQQRASNATFSALPAQNETSQDNNVIQEIPVIAPRATVYNQQAPASSTQNIPTDNTVSSLVSQIFSMNEGEPVGTVINKSSDKTVISVTWNSSWCGHTN